MTDVKWSHKYAVVDLEATGTGSNAKIIQIGIVLIENGKITYQYETDVNPYESLDTHIQQLTGINNEQLAKAPDFSQVAPVIYDLLSEAVFVAHNVQFDANLLSEALFWEGFELRTPRVDTVELAQVFFPTFEKYGLSSLAKELDLPLEKAHTALSDALATAHLLQAIQRKILQTPAQTLHQIAQLADHFIYESRLVLDELLPYASPILPAELVNAGGLIIHCLEEKGSVSELSPDFVANRTALGLVERPEQEAFAAAIASGLTDRHRVHFVQASAGIGKTYGYLLPLLAAQRRAVIAVPTKILQEQIMTEEAQAIHATFGVSFASIKAAQHYVDIAAVWRSLQRVDDNRLLNRCKMQVLMWLLETKTGDLSELKQGYVFPSYLDELRHSGRVEQQSIFAQWDFWHRLQEKVSRIQIVVTNHAFFLQHISSPLFSQRVLVIDEAQKLLVMAEQLANHQFNLQELMQIFQSKADKSDELLHRRLWESSLFECRDLQAGLGNKRQKNVELAELAQLQQNLSELADRELTELEQVLKNSDTCWLERLNQEGQETIVLRASQSQLLDLSQILQQEKIIAISAGLSLQKERDLLDLYGFPEAHMTQFPVKLREHQTLVLPRNLPPLVEQAEEEQVDLVVKQLLDVVVHQLPILVLFTSRRLLLAVSQALEEVGCSHLAQYRHGNEDQLKRKFDKEIAPLLLVTGQFWEGVDFASHERLVEVIVRLPFDNPKDNFVKKVNNRLRAQGKHPFYDHALPMMLLKLAQALGRTSRREGQESLVLLLDSRWQTKRYGQRVREFLAHERPIVEVEAADLSVFVGDWVNKSQ